MNSKTLAILSTVLSLVVVLILGYFIFTPKQEIGNNNAQQNTGNSGTLAEPIVTDAPTSSEWKSYKIGNQEFKSNAIPLFTVVSSGTASGERGF